MCVIAHRGPPQDPLNPRAKSKIQSFCSFGDIVTTPNERARSLIQAGGFPIELAHDKSLPLSVRRKAVAIARHFPVANDVSLTALRSPSFGLDLELDSPGDVAAWAKGYPLGLLHESTRLIWPEEE